MVLYAAANAPLRTIKGEKGAPLNVRPIKPSEESVRIHFTKPHIHFLGSHSGCSCGFNYGYSPNTDAFGRESVAELGSYLAEAVTAFGPIELYACWDGDQAEDANIRVAVTPDQFAGDADEFELTERWFAIVGGTAS